MRETLAKSASTPTVTSSPGRSDARFPGHDAFLDRSVAGVREGMARPLEGFTQGAPVTAPGPAAERNPGLRTNAIPCHLKNHRGRHGWLISAVRHPWPVIRRREQ